MLSLRSADRPEDVSCPCRARPARLAAVATALAVAAALTFGSAPGAHAAPPEPADPPSATPGRYIVVLEGQADRDLRRRGQGPGRHAPGQGRRVNVSTRAGQALPRVSRAAAGSDRGPSGRRGGQALRDRPQRLRHHADRRPGAYAAPRTGRSLGGQGHSPDADRRQEPGRLPQAVGPERSLVGASAERSRAGKGVVVGVIDSGIWPESASFAGPAAGTDSEHGCRSALSRRQHHHDEEVRRWHLPAVSASPARPPPTTSGRPTAAPRSSAPATSPRPTRQVTPAAERTDYLSPRDGDGHGTHVGSTAAGNADVPPTVDGRSYGKISGVAPAAKIASYKVCFTSVTYPDSTCYTGDSLDAIDQAIEDGVDVINYSISSSDDLDDPVDIAFLSAASAGIFVATSAGNSGPGPSTLDHVAPWLTTVAASTVKPVRRDRRAGQRQEVRRDQHRGAGARSARLRWSRPPRSRPAAPPRPTRRCASTERSTGPRPAGKIVVCDRGVIARVEKSDEVKRAGGRRHGAGQPELTNSLDGDSHVRTHRASQRPGLADRAVVRRQVRSQSHAGAGQHLGQRRSSTRR